MDDGSGFEAWRRQALLCSITVFGYTVASALASFADVPRDLEVVELWAGVASVAGAAVAGGVPAASFDVRRQPGVTDAPGPESEDIITEPGFRNALRLVGRLRNRGLLWMAPVCSSWGFANSANTGRRQGNVAGSRRCPAVVEGNLMAEIAMFLFAVAIARGVYAAMENPAGSMLFTYLQKHSDNLGNLTVQCADRCAYGGNYFKKYKFLAAGSWVCDVDGRCSCDKGSHTPLMITGPQGQRTGDKTHMKQSQSYPVELGRAIYKAWHRVAQASVPSSMALGSGSPARWWCESESDTEPRLEGEGAESGGDLEVSQSSLGSVRSGSSDDGDDLWGASKAIAAAATSNENHDDPLWRSTGQVSNGSSDDNFSVASDTPWPANSDNDDNDEAEGLWPSKRARKW